MPHRKEQVESALKRAIATVLTRDLSDPRIEGLVSVVAVEVTADLKAAKVGISVLPERKARTTLAGLKGAAGRIRSLVDRRVEMKAVPQLDFVLDDSLKNEARVLDAIRRGLEVTGRSRGDDPAAETSLT